jgi:hypothetical protein
MIKKIIIELFSVLTLTIVYALIHMWRGNNFFVQEFIGNYCVYFLDRNICSAKESYEILIVMSFFIVKINFLIAIIMILQNKGPHKQLAYNLLAPVLFFTSYVMFEKTNSVRWVGLFILVYNWACFRAMCYYIFEILSKFQAKQRAE